ncbi:DUF2156 domain-containing protein [Sporolituus thermophilus]|uniref:DUF2156 domain-containing protein n=1 Tax=Sporolituus thermophilus TaxID=608505 RepID=UPI001FDFDFFD|nr:phosphatidylglycerol lysyltransferase domain-containing protein [Sporolituus thermophilus]
MKDKPLFDRYFRARRYEASECTFTNLYLWQPGYNLEWALIDGFLCLRALWQGQAFVFPPFGPPAGVESVLDQLAEQFAREGRPFFMKAATVDLVQYLEAVRPGYYHFRADRDNFDYVYLVKDLIELKGRRYNSKKNHLNYFYSYYPQARYVPITPELIPACVASTLAWYDRRCDEDPCMEYEKEAILRAFAHFRELKLVGGAIVIDGKVEAFTFGEALNSDTVVVHIEKGNADFRGIYQVINQQFCHQWRHMRYINREEDMGIEGLRQAKLSYRPVKLVEKYDVAIAK